MLIYIFQKIQIAELIIAITGHFICYPKIPKPFWFLITFLFKTIISFSRYIQAIFFIVTVFCLCLFNPYLFHCLDFLNISPKIEIAVRVFHKALIIPPIISLIFLPAEGMNILFGVWVRFKPCLQINRSYNVNKLRFPSIVIKYINPSIKTA